MKCVTVSLLGVGGRQVTLHSGHIRMVDVGIPELIPFRFNLTADRSCRSLFTRLMRIYCPLFFSGRHTVDAGPSGPFKRGGGDSGRSTNHHNIINCG